MNSLKFFKIYFFPTIMTYLFFGYCYYLPESFSSNYLTLLITFSFPHFMISYYLWWKNKISLKEEVSVWLFPIIFWGSLIFLSYTDNMKAIEVIVQMSYLYLIYHFVRQFYGVILWQSYTQGLEVSLIKKRMMNYMLLSLGLFYWISLQAKTSSMTLFYMRVSNYHFNADTVTIVFMNALISFMAFFLFDFYHWFKNREKLSFFLPYFSIFAAYLWFYPGFSETLRWALALPILHAIQYIPFWFKKGDFKFNHYKLYAFYLISVLAGYLAFRFLPLKLDQILKKQDLGFVSLIVFFNVHHFVIDGKIWKLRKNKKLFAKELASEGP